MMSARVPDAGKEALTLLQSRSDASSVGLPGGSKVSMSIRSNGIPAVLETCRPRGRGWSQFQDIPNMTRGADAALENDC